MTQDPFELAQIAVDIVGNSPHKTNKIAAALQGQSHDGKNFILSRTNFYPKLIEDNLGADTKIGNASPTIHAEMAVLQAAERTEGSAMAITDLFCPNCAKYMAEAGVKTIYIDHKGFDKDWAKRNGKDFEHMSMRIAQHAGISVYVVYRKEKKLVPIFEASSDYTPVVESPVHMELFTSSVSAGRFMDYVGLEHENYDSKPFAAAFARSAAGDVYAIAANEHPSIGYTSGTLDTPEDKYSFILQPLNRLMMVGARHGLRIKPDYLYTSRTPTSRELVNAVGAGFTKLCIGDRTQSRGPNGLIALRQLEEAKIIEIADATHPAAIAAGPR